MTFKYKAHVTIMHKTVERKDRELYFLFFSSFVCEILILAPGGTKDIQGVCGEGLLCRLSSFDLLNKRARVNLLSLSPRTKLKRISESQSKAIA